MRLPVSTYRLQLGPGMGFREARALVPYLDALGISDLYTSPILQARPGSTHGYDVTDPSRLNPELGSPEEFDALAAELARRGMGLLVDIVPNHMAAGADNPWWRSVLEHGSASPFASFFDIDWRPSHSTLDNQVLLPVLAEHYGATLEAGALELAFADGEFLVRYNGQEIPLGPVTWAPLLEAAARELGDSPAASELAEIAAELAALPGRTTRSPTGREHRLTAARRARERLRHLAEDPDVASAVHAVVQRYRGKPGDPRSFDALDRLLNEQAYALAAWRSAAEEINYRRFFDIGDLISVRAEDPRVFEAMHELVLDLVRRRRVTGLRIDHVDGLYDPESYLWMLTGKLREALGGGTTNGAGGDDAPGRPTGAATGELPCYVVVEKILSGDEELPPTWPVHGTTGYDFLNDVNGLFVDPEGLARLQRGFARFTGDGRSFRDLTFDAKRQVIRELFPGDMRSLEWRLIRLARQDRHGRDIPGKELASALSAVTAALDVYRTYVRGGEVSGADRRRIEAAIAEARRRRPDIDPAALSFLRRVLLLELPPDAPAGRRRTWMSFVQRWQQFTGPVTAKGIEDTALYVFNPLTSLNEVGGDPGSGAVSVKEFHRRAAARRAHWPASLNATTTHDTKRGEAVRARISVLSEIPATWQRQLRQWVRWNAPLKPIVGGRPVPDPGFEVLLYQTLLGVWPLDEAELPELRHRLEAYVVKAAREAKVYTSWAQPDEAYEAALREFLGRLLDPGAGNRFLPRFLEFHQRIAAYGAQNAWSQLLLKVAAPGVADVYQGTELWSFTLVDPDNRRSVDFARRAAILAELDAQLGNSPAGAAAASTFAGSETEADARIVALARKLLEHWTDGRITMFITMRLLRLRRARASLFLRGDYVPLTVAGYRRDRVCAFARRQGENWAIAVAPRLVARMVRPGRFALGGVWGRSAVRLPDDAPLHWRDAIAGHVVAAIRRDDAAWLPLSRVLRHLPVALLVPGGSDDRSPSVAHPTDRASG